MYLPRNSRSVLQRAPWNSSILIKLNRTAAERAPAEKSADPLMKSAKEAEAMESNLVGEPVPVTGDSSLVKREHADHLMNADPFEEVPGPQILRKLSSVLKYLPTLGSQATVSLLLSVFQMVNIGTTMTKKQSSRPFNIFFRKYGPVVKLQGPFGAEVVLLNRPEHIAAVYEQEGRYPIRSTLDSVDKCRSRSRKTSGGLYNMCGAEWEEMRRAVQEPLSKSGERYFGAIGEAGEELVRRIRVVRNRQNEVQGDLMHEINKWSLECLCCVTLEKSLGFFQSDELSSSSSEPARLLRAIREATDSICKCEGGLQIWRLVQTPAAVTLSQACEAIDGIISRHIRQAQMNLTRKKNDHNAGKAIEDVSLIESMLLNECMTPDEVLTSILDVLLIGMNTTSSALGFLLYHLAQNQRAQRVLIKELKEILPEKSSRLEYHQLHSLKYLQACLKESLRLKMPMPVLTRILPCDIALSNYRIPKGTYMVMDAQLACLKEHNFEKADKFLPERWLDPVGIDPIASVPFGRGPRACVGRRLAEIQLWSCAANILRNFLVEYNYEDINGTDSVISFPDKPLKLTFIEREG